MRTVTEKPVNNTDDLPSFDGIPLPNGADSILVFLPLAAWVIAYGVREFIKVKIENIKAEAQAEIERERAEARERAQLIEELREQNRMFTREILNLNQVMERSGPLIDPPSKVDR